MKVLSWYEVWVGCVGFSHSVFAQGTLFLQRTIQRGALHGSSRPYAMGVCYELVKIRKVGWLSVQRRLVQVLSLRSSTTARLSH